MTTRPKTPIRSIDGVVRQPVPKQKGQRKWKLPLAFVVGLLIIISLTVLLTLKFGANQSEPKPSVNDDPNSIKAAVANHFLLPTDEEPALATVTDKTKLNSAFRGKAENGDRILIYQANQQALVYRPSIDKVVATVPVTIDSPPTPNN